jgi:hypothetical protein
MSCGSAGVCSFEGFVNGGDVKKNCVDGGAGGGVCTPTSFMPRPAGAVPKVVKSGGNVCIYDATGHVVCGNPNRK